MPRSARAPARAPCHRAQGVSAARARPARPALGRAPGPTCQPPGSAPHASPLTSGARLSAPSSPPHPRHAALASLQSRRNSRCDLFPRDPHAEARPALLNPSPRIPCSPFPHQRRPKALAAPPCSRSQSIAPAAAATPLRYIGAPENPRKSIAVAPGNSPSSLPRNPGPTSPELRPARSTVSPCSTAFRHLQ